MSKTTPSTKTLAELFLGKMHERDGMTMRMLADATQCDDSTMRGWFRNDKFPLEVARAISTYLGIDDHKLPDPARHPEQYTTATGRKRRPQRTPHTFTEAIEWLDQICALSYPNRPPILENEVNSTVRKLIDAMGKNCFWFTTTQTKLPGMLRTGSEHGFAEGLCGAVARGMRMAAVIPTSGFIRDELSPFNVEGWAPHASLVSEFQAFNTALVRHLTGVGDASAEDTAASRVQLFEANRFLFTPAGSVVTVIGKAESSDNTVTRVLIEHPTEFGLGLVLLPDHRLYRDMAQAFMQSVIRAATADEAWHAHAVELGLSTPDDATSAIRHRKAFRETFSQIRRASVKLDYSDSK